MEKKNDYRISFFKPTTAFSKINRNLVIVLVIIWAVAIFGFQILLKVVEKPTPESSLFTFEEVWSNVKDGNASLDEKIKFADAVLSVLGKSTILAKPQKKATLNNAFSWIVYDMIAEEEKENFKAEISAFEQLKANITTLKDNDYINAKASIIEKVAPLLRLENHSLKAKLIPLELKADAMEVFTTDNINNIHGIMKLYLTHNQSFLTDTIVLGFPFHYFYTAILLLVMFVILCWVYCFKIDKVHTKIGTYDKKNK